MLPLKLNHVIKRGPRTFAKTDGSRIQAIFVDSADSCPDTNNGLNVMEAYIVDRLNRRSFQNTFQNKLIYYYPFGFLDP